jgi:chromosome partitioning protein
MTAVEAGMLMQANTRLPASAHVVVIGNEKGGSGKSTTAMHVAAALMNVGQRVATIDLDSRQKTFTHYIEHRRSWAERACLDLTIPTHFCIERGTTLKLDDNEAIEFSSFAAVISSVQQNHDFVVIDTPGTDSYLSRLAHSMADTLVTPINDSFVDFDVLGRLDPATYDVIGESHYAEMVRDARRQRRQVDGTGMDWVVVRNRLSVMGSRNKRLMADGLNELAMQLGFRCADGLAERPIYREFFPRGLTALDTIDDIHVAPRAGVVDLAATQEVTALIAALKLPIDERGQRRAAARAEWFLAQDKPLDVHDILDR